MPKILIIGKDLSNKNFDFLKKYGDISKFKSIDRVRIGTNDDIALLVVERTQHREPSFKDFSKTVSGVPKLIVSSDNSFRGFSPWLRLPQVFPVHNPDEKELLFLADRLISEKSLQQENNRLKNEISSARGELDLFRVIGKILTSNRELDEVLALIMKEVKKEVGASSWSIFLVDEETGELVLEKTDDKRWKPHKVRLKPGEGVAGWVVREGIPVVVPDISQDKRSLYKTGKRKYPRANTVMCIPIRDKDRTVGVIEFTDKTTGIPFTKDDLDLFMRIVDYAAVAIKVASVYQKMAEISVTDDLTKLFNSRYLNRTIEVEIQRSERSRSSVSLIFMDIDYFK
ncbi:MAG TPA: GAF domain-containing protein, partial [Thermodesulfovibrionales bacterium]|nr:GAF domain-containing protein [Thermodesulfovibrionales bacterium]